MNIFTYYREILGNIWFNLYYCSEFYILDFRDRKWEFGALSSFSSGLSLHRGHRLVITRDLEGYLRRWKEYHGWDEEKVKEHWKKRAEV
jgi:hypothetical protein